jgi:cyanate permease
MGSWSSNAIEYRVVAAGTVSYTCLMFIWFSLPASLSEVTTELGLSNTQAGILVGAVPVTYIPLALFSGLAVDRIGPVRSLAGGLIVFGSAQIGRSIATGFPLLLGCTVLIGVGATVITFGLPKLVSLLFPPEQTGAPSSVYLVGASLGTASAFAIGRPVLGPLLGGWRELFLWSGIVAVCYAGVWLLTMRISNWTANAEDNESSFAIGTLKTDIKAVLTHREVRFVVLVGVTYLLIIHGLQGWLPTILESRGLSAERAGQTTTLLVMANVVGVLTIPGLADRFRARRLAIILAGFTAFCGVGAILGGGTTIITAVGIVAAGLGVGGLSPLVRAIPSDLDGIGAQLTGTAVGLVFAVGEVGGFLGPVLIGSLHDITGTYAAGLAILAGGGLLAVTAGAAMRTINSP